MKKALSSAYNWFLKFLHMQLFITLGSLPILMCWGLPWSIMSPIGNLLFTPFLLAFLLLSSLFFFFELLHIPNNGIGFLLEHVVEWWSKILRIHYPSWLISFKKPPIIILVLIMLATFFVIHHKKLNRPPQSIVCFLFIFFLSFSYCSFLELKKKCFSVPCNNGTVIVAHANHKTALIDPGFLGQRPSSVSWIEYTLLPALNKTIGSNCVDYVVVLQPSSLTFEAITNLCNQITIKAVYLATWQGTAQKSFYHNYGIMKKTLKEKNVSLYRLTDKGSTIKLDDNNLITIMPLAKQLKYHDISFPALQVHTCLGHDKLIISSAKLKD